MIKASCSRIFFQNPEYLIIYEDVHMHSVCVHICSHVSTRVPMYVDLSDSRRKYFLLYFFLKIITMSFHLILLHMSGYFLGGNIAQQLIQSVHYRSWLRLSSSEICSTHLAVWLCWLPMHRQKGKSGPPIISSYTVFYVTISQSIFPPCVRASLNLNAAWLSVLIAVDQQCQES